MSFKQKLTSLLQTYTRQLSRASWELLLIAALISIGASVWPAARCALADCSAEDRWCSGDCLRACGPVTGVGFVSSCYIQAGQCRQRWFPDRVQLTCQRDGNCAFDSASRYQFRKVEEGYWNVGACGKFPNCNPLVSNVDYVTCCGTGSADNDTPSCLSEYDPPTLNLTGARYSPSRPLVIGQDPDRLGVEVSGVTAQGGLHHCPDDGRRARITGFRVQVDLSSASREWILGELSRKYPGAEIKGTYPILPQPRPAGLQSSSASLSFHFDPLDPGVYEATITVTQEEGKTAVGTLQVPVWLLEATITR